MEFSLDCYPCAVRHTLLAVRRADMNEELQNVVMQRVLQGLLDLKPGATSPEIMTRIHAIIREVTGIEDFYRKEKLEGTQEALALYPRLKEEILHSSDPFETAVRLSIAGNIIDYGALDGYDLQDTIQRVMEQPLALNDLEALRTSIEQADQIMILADNAGETVFDRLLIETIQKPVVYVVKEAPILNDATRADAREAGLDAVAEVISCGARCPGTLLELCSPAFLDRFGKAELIIAKGMGNFEALNTVKAPIFFLLQVKCDLVARNLSLPRRSIVVIGNSTHANRAN